jgi:hypothetical protein
LSFVTFHDHSATPAALIARRRLSALQALGFDWGNGVIFLQKERLTSDVSKIAAIPYGFDTW